MSNTWVKSSSSTKRSHRVPTSVAHVVGNSAPKSVCGRQRSTAATAEPGTPIIRPGNNRAFLQSGRMAVALYTRRVERAAPLPGQPLPMRGRVLQERVELCHSMRADEKWSGCLRHHGCFPPEGAPHSRGGGLPALPRRAGSAPFSASGATKGDWQAE